jgi:hypothetical protein
VKKYGPLFLLLVVVTLTTCFHAQTRLSATVGEASHAGYQDPYVEVGIESLLASVPSEAHPGRPVWLDTQFRYSPTNKIEIQSTGHFAYRADGGFQTHGMLFGGGTYYDVQDTVAWHKQGFRPDVVFGTKFPSDNVVMIRYFFAGTDRLNGGHGIDFQYDSPAWHHIGVEWAFVGMWFHTTDLPTDPHFAPIMKAGLFYQFGGGQKRNRTVAQAPTTTPVPANTNNADRQCCRR